MSSTSYVRALGSGVIARVDGLLFSLPKAYRAVGVLLLQGLLFFAYSMFGPWIPLGLFFLLNLYFAVKYVDGRYAYFVALFAAAGKTYIKAGYFPEESQWWQAQWQFVSSLSIYLMFCYLMNMQLEGRKHIEVALDKLSILNKAIVTNTDSAILVFKDTGECIIANDAAARIFGKPVERLRQLNYQIDLGWPRNGLHEAVQTTMRSGIELKFTTKLDNAVGSALWCVTSLSQIEHGNTAYLLMVLTDITAYKEAEDAIQRADKETAVALARAGVAERKLLSISEETQQRIGRELHDDLGQHLTGVAFLSEVLFQKLKEANSKEMQHAAKITALVNESLSRTRILAHGLYPAELAEKGFVPMIEKFAYHFGGIHQVECEFHCQPGCQINDTDIAINLFRLTQEAAINAVKHGNAKHIEMRLSLLPDNRVSLEILDDGCGFTPDASKDSGLGLRSMRYRAEIIGASLEISSGPTGGTTVAVYLPLTNEERSADAESI